MIGIPSISLYCSPACISSNILYNPQCISTHISATLSSVSPHTSATICTQFTIRYNLYTVHLSVTVSTVQYSKDTVLYCTVLYNDVLDCISSEFCLCQYQLHAILNACKVSRCKNHILRAVLTAVYQILGFCLSQFYPSVRIM